MVTGNIGIDSFKAEFFNNCLSVQVFHTGN